MQGLLRGLFTRGTTHSNPTTPTNMNTLRLSRSKAHRAALSRSLGLSPSSSVLSSKAGLSSPASSVHMGPLLPPLLLLDLEGGDGVLALRSV